MRCLAQHGRFCEIGKFDLSVNNNLGMAVFLKNVTFHGILLDSLMDGGNAEWMEVRAMFEQGMRQGVVVPLPETVSDMMHSAFTVQIFAPDKAEEAFRYMSTGKHMGKVLIEVRPEERQLTAKPTAITVRAACRAVPNPQHAYIITGGLGGFGLEVAQWLINRGAKK